MPAPSPSIVTTLCAKVDTSVVRVRKYTPASATVMDSTPTRSGRPVATSAPNTRSSTIAVRGSAVNSLRFVSCSAKRVKSCAMGCPPVTR